MMSDPVDPADQQAILEYQGKRHALPVKHGCIRAADLKPAAGLMSYDPGTSLLWLGAGVRIVWLVRLWVG